MSAAYFRRIPGKRFMTDIELVKVQFFTSRESHETRVLLWRVKGVQGSENMFGDLQAGRDGAGRRF